MTTLTAKEFLVQSGMEEDMFPGQVKYREHISEKEGNSYIVKYDWSSDLNQIAVEIIPGLTGSHPTKKELSKFAIWLQTENRVVFELGLERNDIPADVQDNLLSAVKAASNGKASLYQSLATKATNTARIIGEKMTQIPIAVEGARQMCKIALSKAFHKSNKKDDKAKA